MLLCIDKTTGSKVLNPKELDVLSDLKENLLFKYFFTEENNKRWPNLLALFTLEDPLEEEYGDDEDEPYFEEDEEEALDDGFRVERLIFARGEGPVDKQFESAVNEVWFETVKELFEELDVPGVHSIVRILGIADENGQDTDLRLCQLVSEYDENYIMVFAFTNEEKLQLAIEGFAGLYYALNIIKSPEEPDRDAFVESICNIDKVTLKAIKRRVDSWFASERPSVVAWRNT